MDEEKPGTHIYRVTNSGPSGRVIYNTRRKPVTVSPGQSVEVDMDVMTAGRIVTVDSGLEVVQVAGGGTRVRPVESVATAGGSGKTSEGRTANEILAALERRDESYSTLMVESRHLIGEDKWPGGVPKKADVQRLLREHPSYVKD